MDVFNICRDAQYNGNDSAVPDEAIIVADIPRRIRLHASSKLKRSGSSHSIQYTLAVVTMAWTRPECTDLLVYLVFAQDRRVPVKSRLTIGSSDHGGAASVGQGAGR
jgi:hypothetical protein